MQLNSTALLNTISIDTSDFPMKSNRILSKYNTGEWFQYIQRQFYTNSNNLKPQIYLNLLKVIGKFQKFSYKYDREFSTSNFTPNCFWFMICALYFSREGYIQNKTPEEIFNETIIILDLIVFKPKNQLKKQKSNDDFGYNGNEIIREIPDLQISERDKEIGYLKNEEIDIIKQQLANYGECLKYEDKNYDYLYKNKKEDIIFQQLQENNDFFLKKIENNKEEFFIDQAYENKETEIPIISKYLKIENIEEENIFELSDENKEIKIPILKEFFRKIENSIKQYDENTEAQSQRFFFFSSINKEKPFNFKRMNSLNNLEEFIKCKEENIIERNKENKKIYVIANRNKSVEFLQIRRKNINDQRKIEQIIDFPKKKEVLNNIVNKLENLNFDENIIQHEDLPNMKEFLKKEENIIEYLKIEEDSIEDSKPNIKIKDSSQKMNFSSWTKSRDPYNQSKIQLSEFQLSFLIDYLENEANKLKESSTIKFNEIKEKMIEEYKNLLPIIRFAKKSEYNILMDLDNNSIREKEFFDYLETKHHDSKILSFESIDGYYNNNKNLGLHEIVCQICNEKDLYEEEDPFVLCYLCNMTIHRKCYGILEILEKNWICELCKDVGTKGKNMPCPLCPLIGGAMKQTFLLANEIIRPYFPNLNYDEIYFKNDFLSKNVWVHFSCARWIPELHFYGTNEIIDLDTIEVWRFYIKCEVCKMMNLGAVIQCCYKRCPRFFHVECGKKVGIYLEKMEWNYLLYCDKHAPHKIKREMIARSTKAINEITRYFRNFCILSKYEKKKNGENFFLINLKLVGENYLIENVFCPIKEEYRQKSESCKKRFFKKILYKINNMKEKNAKKYQEKKQKRKKSLVKAIENRNDLKICKKILKKIIGKKTGIKMKKIEEIYNDNSIKENPIEILSYNIEKHSSPKQNKDEFQKIIALDINNISKINDNIIINYELDQLYCICQIKCNNLDNNVINCVICARKFHFKCVGFKGTTEDVNNIEFVCKSCDSQGNITVRRVRRILYNQFFENYYDGFDKQNEIRKN